MRILDDRPEIWPFILISLLLHAMFFLLMSRMMKEPKYVERPIEVVPIIEDANKSYRIADIDKPDVEKRPEKAKLLGMYDSAVKEEKVADGRIRKGERGEREKRGEREEKPEGKQKVQEKKGQDKLFTFNKNVLDEGAKKGLKSGDSGAPGGDFFPDYHRGPKTYLNVLRYPDVDYFVRMKRVFRMTFNPAPSLREYFSANRVSLGSVDVVLGVSVDRTGNLAELFIFRSSGIASYDEETLRTVRASAPFSTPPDKFLEKDGLLRMSWTFTVYL